MRILQVTLGFYPAQAWGGPVKIVHQNCKELVKRGHQVTVYCTNLFNKKEKIRPGTFEQNIDGIRVLYLETVNFHWWPGTLGPIWIPELSAYLAREIRDYDVVHLNGYRSSLMRIPAKAARSAGIPVVTQPHGTLPVIAHSHIWKRLYDIFYGRLELGSISALIALQESEKLQAISHGISASLIEVIPNGIDPDGLQPLPVSGTFRKRLGINDDQPLILFMGRINKIKGVDLLIDAFTLLGRADARLVIAGPDDGQLAVIKAKIRRNKIEHQVVLPGLLLGEDVKAAFMDADLFVLPSRYDAFPTSIMEACQMEIPMVVTDCCEIAQLVKDRVAEVVPFESQAFANGMRSLLSDRSKYALFKSNCQAMIKDTFSILVTVDRLEAVYRRVIEESTRRN